MKKLCNNLMQEKSEETTQKIVLKAREKETLSFSRAY